MLGTFRDRSHLSRKSYARRARVAHREWTGQDLPLLLSRFTMAPPLLTSCPTSSDDCEMTLCRDASRIPPRRRSMPSLRLSDLFPLIARTDSLFHAGLVTEVFRIK